MAGLKETVQETLAISFMAFACIRQLMYRIMLQHKALSPEVIRNALIHVQHSVFKHKRTKKSYVMPAQINPEAKKIYAVMGLKETTTPPVLIDIILKYLGICSAYIFLYFFVNK